MNKFIITHWNKFINKNDILKIIFYIIVLNQIEM